MNPDIEPETEISIKLNRRPDSNDFERQGSRILHSWEVFQDVVLMMNSLIGDALFDAV